MLCKGERDRISFSALNQLLCGHSILGAHMAKINPTVLNLNLNSLLHGDTPNGIISPGGSDEGEISPLNARVKRTWTHNHLTFQQ